MGLERALRSAGGDGTLSEPCGRQIRPAAAHAVRRNRRLGSLGRTWLPLAHQAGRRERINDAIFVDRSRLVISADSAALCWLGDLQRAVLPYLLLSARRCRL